jgi:crotonobetainyl-CoA:carnitine CoA-transferase CaiB-like acyl-CoA transferase
MAHPHAEAVSTLPLFDIVTIGDRPPEPLNEAGERPLSGIRVLDLTHVIAGPVGGRTLAEHGADVLRLKSPHRPSQLRLEIDSGHGKRSAQLDLRQDQDAVQLRALVQQADVFSQGYRPGALAARGFSPEALAELRPGIVCVSLSAYSHAGPWQQKRGFDSLVQSVSGIVHAETAGAATPRHLPAQALDYCSGYLMAFGAMMALARRAREGGSYLVRITLCQTGHWIYTLGHLQNSVDGRTHPMPQYADVQDLMIDDVGPFGTVRHVTPAVQLSATLARWTSPTTPFGTHEPVWAA